MLKNINIKNFRSIKEISIDLPSNYIVLTGENNTGKTNVLRALLSFKSIQEFQEIDYYEFDDDIEISLSDCQGNKLQNDDSLSIFLVNPHVTISHSESFEFPTHS